MSLISSNPCNLTLPSDLERGTPVPPTPTLPPTLIEKRRHEKGSFHTLFFVSLRRGWKSTRWSLKGYAL